MIELQGAQFPMPRGRPPGVEGDEPRGSLSFGLDSPRGVPVGVQRFFSRDRNVAGAFDLFVAQIS